MVAAASPGREKCIVRRKRLGNLRVTVCIALLLPLTACVAPGVFGGRVVEPLLVPWRSLSGGRLEGAMVPGVGRYIPFARPVAVSARGNDIYIADGGRRRIYRFDRALQTLSVFYHPIPSAVALYAAFDRSVYVAEPSAGRVLQIGPDGTLLHTFSNAANLARPVAVAVDEVRGRVLIADGLYNHILIFNHLGGLTGVIVPRDSASHRLRGIRAMSLGPDGLLYVVDGLKRRVVVVGPNGSYRYSFGEGRMVDPVAIAVDRYRRAFVADAFNNTIEVYAQGREVAVFGGTGLGLGHFTQITGLCLDENKLYVTDGGRGDVQILQVAPPEMRRRSKHSKSDRLPGPTDSK